MTEELDDKGQYPLPEDWAGKRAEQFNTLWRDHLSFHPTVATISWERREKAKEFAWAIYKEALMQTKEVQELLTKAYKDGEENGANNLRDKVRDKLGELMDTLGD